MWLPMAEQGNLLAQNYVGIHHYLGLGVDRDFRKAVTWFAKAAVKGYPDAQYNLGAMYANGEHVAKDYYKAYLWFFAADHNGNQHAAKRLTGIASEHKLLGNQVRYAEQEAKQYINKEVISD